MATGREGPGAGDVGSLARDRGRRCRDDAAGRRGEGKPARRPRRGRLHLGQHGPATGSRPRPRRAVRFGGGPHRGLRVARGRSLAAQFADSARGRSHDRRPIASGAEDDRPGRSRSGGNLRRGRCAADDRASPGDPVVRGTHDAGPAAGSWRGEVAGIVARGPRRWCAGLACADGARTTATLAGARNLRTHGGLFPGRDPAAAGGALGRGCGCARGGGADRAFRWGWRLGSDSRRDAVRRLPRFRTGRAARPAIRRGRLVRHRRPGSRRRCRPTSHPGSRIGPHPDWRRERRSGRSRSGRGRVAGSGGGLRRRVGRRRVG